MTTRAIPEPTPGPTTGAATGVAVPAPGRRLPSQRGLLLDLDALPERLAAIVTAGEGVIQQRGLVRTAVVCDPALSRELLSRPTGTSQGKGIAALRLTLGQARDVSLAQTQLLECFPRLLRPTGLVAARLPTRLGRRVRRSVALLDRRSNTSWLTGAGTATPVT